MNLRRGGDKADSLGLLFDTICNAFGGIIVIAVLVALMSHEIKQSEDDKSASQSTSAIVSRRLARAEQDLSGTQKAIAELNQRLSSEEPGQEAELARKSALSTELQQLQQKEARDQVELDNLRKANAISDPGLKKQEITRQQTQEESELKQKQQEIAEMAANNQILEVQVTSLVDKVKEDSMPLVKNLRLPKEHSTDKNPWFIIIKGNELFSKYQVNSGELTDNQSIFTVDKNGDSETWTPIKGSGVPEGDSNAIEQLISLVKQNGCYISFVVYDDSFDAFITARDIAILNNVEYGWIPQEQSTPTVFSTTGTVPLPQ